MKVADVIDRAVKRGDIEKAIDWAVGAVKKAEDWPPTEQLLVRSFIQAKIEDSRHHVNVAHRRAAGVYGGPAKVVPGAEVASVMRGLLDTYFLAGRCLGDIRGEDLGGLADSCSELAAGHQFNAELCRRLAERVPANKAVRQVLTNRQVKAIFESIPKRGEARDEDGTAGAT